MPLKSLHGFGVPAESYGFAGKELAWETIPLLLDRASPLRTAHPRGPVGPQILASAAKQSHALDRDCFVAYGSSQLAFRLRNRPQPRDIGVVKAAAERAGSQPRPSPRPDCNADTLTGRGIAYAQRLGAVVAIVAEVEIGRRSGKVCARNFGGSSQPVSVVQIIERRRFRAALRPRSSALRAVRYSTCRVAAVIAPAPSSICPSLARDLQAE